MSDMNVRPPAGASLPPAVGPQPGPAPGSPPPGAPRPQHAHPHLSRPALPPRPATPPPAPGGHPQAGDTPRGTADPRFGYSSSPSYSTRGRKAMLIKQTLVGAFENIKAIIHDGPMPNTQPGTPDGQSYSPSYPQHMQGNDLMPRKSAWSVATGAFPWVMLATTMGTGGIASIVGMMLPAAALAAGGAFLWKLFQRSPQQGQAGGQGGTSGAPSDAIGQPPHYGQPQPPAQPPRYAQAQQAAQPPQYAPPQPPVQPYPAAQAQQPAHAPQAAQPQRPPQPPQATQPQRPAQPPQATQPQRPAQPPQAAQAQQPAQAPQASQPPRPAQPPQATQPQRPAQPPQATQPQRPAQPPQAAPPQRPAPRPQASDGADAPVDPRLAAWTTVRPLPARQTPQPRGFSRAPVTPEEAKAPETP